MARMLIETGAAGKPACFRGAWVRLDLADFDDGEAAPCIAVSYGAIRAGLTKKVRATLPAGPDRGPDRGTEGT